MDVALIPSAPSPFLGCALATVDERAVVNGERDSPGRYSIGPNCSWPSRCQAQDRTLSAWVTVRRDFLGRPEEGRNQSHR